ncbi:MAG: hypothetical protein HZC38_07845 [Chloroflexi bacterium]|nr:hypothetical protein [Chloroflexota bacterium]
MVETLDSSILISQLASQGVRHLRSAQATVAAASLNTDALIAELARRPEPRLRESLIPLFIRHPEYSEVARKLVETLEPTASESLAHMYTAAVYLQRFWSGTLGLSLKSLTLLPNYFGVPRYNLPDENEHFGESGLRALAKLYEEKTGYNWLSAYHSIIALLLDQLLLEGQHE